MTLADEPTTTARFRASGGLVPGIFTAILIATLVAVWAWRVPGSEELAEDAAPASEPAPAGFDESFPAASGSTFPAASGSTGGEPSPSGRRRSSLTDPLWDNAVRYPGEADSDPVAAGVPGGFGL